MKGPSEIEVVHLASLATESVLGQPELHRALRSIELCSDALDRHAVPAQLECTLALVFVEALSAHPDVLVLEDPQDGALTYSKLSH